MRTRMMKALTGVGLAVALLMLPSPTIATADPRPPLNRLQFCGGLPFTGSGAQTVGVRIKVPGPVATVYYVRVYQIGPLGWVGKVAFAGYEHGQIRLPRGTWHWVRSPAILWSSKGPLNSSFQVRPAVAGAYGVQVWAGYRCRMYAR